MTRVELQRVSILGTGKMGSAVGLALAAAGLDITYGSRTPETTSKKFSEFRNVTVTDIIGACRAGGPVIVAVPWSATLDLMRQVGSELTDRTIIDMTNPTSPDWSYLTTDGRRSGAEQIAETLASSRVVKMFNGIIADNFSNPGFSGEQVQAFFCGGSPIDKEIAASIIVAAGYSPVDLGPLDNARYLEPIAMLWIQLAFWEEWGPNFSFKVIGEFPEPNTAS